MIVFLACTKRKADRPCQAKDMYQGDLFKKSLRYAQRLNPQKIYILSAKYGLLELDDQIEPYEKTLNSASKQERKQWSYMVYKQLQNKGTDFNEETIFLSGENYRHFLKQLFSNATMPLKGLGIGRQLQYYKQREGLHEKNNI